LLRLKENKVWQTAGTSEAEA